MSSRSGMTLGLGRTLNGSFHPECAFHPMGACMDPPTPTLPACFWAPAKCFFLIKAPLRTSNVLKHPSDISSCRASLTLLRPMIPPSAAASLASSRPMIPLS